MMVFGDYARYYDLLYRDKKYDQEVDYVESLMVKYAPQAKTIIDFGCGTGRHAFLFAQRGYFVHGVDMSKEMLDAAKQRSAYYGTYKDYVEFSHADIRLVNLEKSFDVVVALFHVMSYQVTNESLRNAFLAAYRHLKPGGIIIFDCWYGPAVLSDPPVVRVKRLEEEAFSITRISEPRINYVGNTVDIDFTVYIKNFKTDSIHTLHETHAMRYLFVPEVDFLLKDVGFTLLAKYEWGSAVEPSAKNWNACFVGKRV